MNPTIPSWVTVLSALLTPAIALSVALIAYRQWRTAQNRLKLDLFDRCLAIHTEALEIISKVASNTIEPTDLTKFEPAARQARWLLDEEVERYFKKEFIPKVTDHIAERLGAYPLTRELSMWIMAQEDALDAKFDRFLKIKA